MNVKSLIGWGIAIGGGYLLLRSLGYDPLAMLGVGVGSAIGTPLPTGGTTSIAAGANQNTNTSTSVNTNTGAAATTTTNANPAQNTNSTTTADIRSLIKTSMKNYGYDINGLYSVDVLNVFYKKIRGIDGPAPEDLFPLNPRDTNYTVSEYWAAMSNAGFSGLAGSTPGMGTIARMNPYTNAFINTGRSRNAALVAQGSELRMKYIN